jgi:hypothetical protein
MKLSLLIQSALALALYSAAGQAPASQAPAKAAAALNSQAQKSLGVSVRALAFLFEADPGSFLAKRSVALQAAWPQLMELQRAGYVRVNTFPSASGELVQIVLTPKGQAVAEALGGP